ncbi:hypothetical protein [Streptomyces sp. C10-9-1]|uniref:hypothetical protein n=1 Tax=Streptomyces sp. C10-9-1 TaxID=1859285 RepID=UPI003D759019
MTEETIPLLPCRAVRPVVVFYTAPGFGNDLPPDRALPLRRGPPRFRSNSPFYGMAGHEPAAAHSGCLVAGDGDVLCAAFRAGLQTAYGRVPRTGRRAWGRSATGRPVCAGS